MIRSDNFSKRHFGKSQKVVLAKVSGVFIYLQDIKKFKISKKKNSKFQKTNFKKKNSKKKFQKKKFKKKISKKKFKKKIQKNFKKNRFFLEL